MRLVISVAEAGDDQELKSLYRWLSRDAFVIGQVQLTVDAVGRGRGEMGGAIDVINAVFADASAAAAIGSLIVAFRAWRDTRQEPSTMKIDKGGVTILVSSGSEKELEHVLKLMFHGADQAQIEGDGKDAEKSL